MQKETIIAAVITGIATIAAATITAAFTGMIPLNGEQKANHDEVSVEDEGSNAEIDRMTAENESLAAENESLAFENEASKKENSSLKERLSDLESEINRAASENKDLVDEAYAYSLEIDSYKAELEDAEERNDKLSQENEELKKELDTIKKEKMKTPSATQPPDISSNDEKTSIFALEPFTGTANWAFLDEPVTDMYGKEYASAYIIYHSKSYETYNSPKYLLDYKYSKCEGEIAWLRSEKDSIRECWIEFHTDDGLLYKTDIFTAEDRPMSFEFSVEGVEKVTIVPKSDDYDAICLIYSYFNFVK